MNQSERTLGKYRLIERLGQGGMAQVYRAQQPTIDRPVAIKVLHAHLAGQDDFITRFQREARGLGQLRHPHIVQVIDFDVMGDEHYMVMDFIAGPTLRQVLDQRGALPLEAALLIAEQMADALAYAHAQGAIHRDVKPGNIMLLEPWRDALAPHSVLTDFGIARLLDDSALTLTGAVTGTPAYMSPEAAQGAPLDARSDLYSLGVVLYEMVSGVTPYPGETAVRVLLQHLQEPLPPLRTHRPDLPDLVVQIVERALVKEPADRFANAEAMRLALLQARLTLSDGQIPLTRLIPAQTLASPQPLSQPAAPTPRPASPPTPLLKPPPPVRRNPLARWAGVGLLLLLLAVGSGWLLYDQLPSNANADEGRVAVGHLQVRPTANGLDLVLTLDSAAHLAALPDRQHYHVWLTAQDGVIYDLGALTLPDQPTAAVRHVATSQNDLLAHLTGVLITHEQTETPTAPANAVVIRGTAQPERIAALWALLVASELRLNKALLPAANEQLSIVEQHYTMLTDALAAGDLALAQKHAEHLVNIGDGVDGPNFGDLNGDGQAQNPGDGVGLRTYLASARAPFDVLTLPHLPLEQALTASEGIITAARQVTAADTLAEARQAAAQIGAALAALVDSPAGQGALAEILAAVGAVSVMSLQVEGDQ